MRLNNELFPTFGRPTHPILRLDLTRPKATTLFVVASAAFFGGIMEYSYLLSFKDKVHGREVVG